MHETSTKLLYTVTCTDDLKESNQLNSFIKRTNLQVYCINRKNK